MYIYIYTYIYIPIDLIECSHHQGHFVMYTPHTNGFQRPPRRSPTSHRGLPPVTVPSEMFTPTILCTQASETHLEDMPGQADCTELLHILKL